MDIINIKNWGWEHLKDAHPIVIAGPCSAETKEQVLQTATAVANAGAHILRAGIWKPRTRPNSFEGLGEEALPWLIMAGKLTGLPVCAEVANAAHVELALKAGVDILWIGARTSVNPFAVQDIADALKGIDIPIMVKNPVNPDLELWIGAIERIYQAGIKKLAAVHRGFSVYNSDKYRNKPEWEIPIELRRRVPGLEVICDPSHIAGKRDLIYEVSQEAMDLNFDGLMIEAHIDPTCAWSDAQQQLNPVELNETLMKLVYRKEYSSDPIFNSQLETLRKQIDGIDLQILKLLAQRMEVVRNIGEYKKDNNISILQMERWAEMYKMRTGKADDLGVSKEFIEHIINAIHQESIQQQKQIMEEHLIKVTEKRS
ncbi:MAG: bifunctional 3-deoxy-7-phosphoheptulonate synthase/chorismate mutase type II [Aureispira sp.]|nr:bifunctional 3-deoxy-7-phosphoheptulonate synthase/chorismate mutase type II [Aureispira sp.]